MHAYIAGTRTTDEMHTEIRDTAESPSIEVVRHEAIGTDVVQSPSSVHCLWSPRLDEGIDSMSVDAQVSGGMTMFAMNVSTDRTSTPTASLSTSGAIDSHREWRQNRLSLTSG